MLDTCAKSYFLLQVSKIQIKLLKNTLKIILFLFFLLSAQNLIITKKTVKSIVFINHTKLYCRKISFFYKDNIDIMLISTTRILTELRLKLLC